MAKEKLELQVGLGAKGVGRGPHRLVAPPEHAVARAQGLPGEAVDGEAVDHALGNPIATEASPLVALMAIGAGEPKLPPPFPEEGLPPSQGWGRFRGNGLAQGQAPGAVRQARRERK